MAELKVTHIGKFFQGFSHRIPYLKELRVWRRDLLTRTHQIIRVTFVTSKGEFARKGLDYDLKWGVVPPYTPCRFLLIS